ncbi:MAG: hypothetical protein QOF72_2785 [Blastocatellia bacterium]|jgi:hypothetical protein|nr:hypothetical protein [Blastocatellia bacterium]
MIELSAHAETRCRQRGITAQRLATLLENADVERPVGKNCRLVKVSRRAAKWIRGSDGLASLSVIISDHTGEVVTILRPASTRRGRRYRGGA